jgi:hypothetical protein
MKEFLVLLHFFFVFPASAADLDLPALAEQTLQSTAKER